MVVNSYQNDYLQKKADIITMSYITPKPYINMGKFVPNVKIFNKQIEPYNTPLFSAGKCSQKYENRNHTNERSQKKDQKLNLYHKLYHNELQQNNLLKNKNYTNHAYSQGSTYRQKKLSLVTTPLIHNGLFLSVGKKQKFDTHQIQSSNKNQQCRTNQQDSISRRCSSLNKKNKFITVISRMPINKKKSSVHMY